ncbi:hypothetical protein ABIB59_001992 [Citrobacter sp. UYEF32]
MKIELLADIYYSFILRGKRIYCFDLINPQYELQHIEYKKFLRIHFLGKEGIPDAWPGS